jgi:hypothetical protein
MKRFRKLRREKARKLFLKAVLMPAVLILLGYLVASVIILPAMTG